MKNKFRRVTALLLCMLTVNVPLRAAVYDDADVEKPKNVSRGTMPGEAARAVFGRVFGVRGEGGDIQYNVLELSNHSPVNSTVRSAFVPGWGQAFNRQPVKGMLLFSAFAASIFGCAALYKKSTDSYDHYRSLGVRDDSSYDDYKRQRTESIVLGSAAVVFWVFGMVDAYRRAYNPLYSESHQVEVAFNENGGQVQWEKKF